MERGMGNCVTRFFFLSFFIWHFMWKRSSVSCHQTHLSEKESERRKRERKKFAASAVWLQSGMREGEEGLVQHSSSKSRDCGGGQKGTCWPWTQVSFIHTCTHTHIRTQDEQQHPSGFCYIWWLLICAFGVNYYFSLISRKQTPYFFKLNDFFKLKRKHLAAGFWAGEGRIQARYWCWTSMQTTYFHYTVSAVHRVRFHRYFRNVSGNTTFFLFGLWTSDLLFYFKLKSFISLLLPTFVWQLYNSFIIILSIAHQ